MNEGAINRYEDSWQELRFDERELYGKTSNETNIERIKELLESE